MWKFSSLYAAGLISLLYAPTIQASPLLNQLPTTVIGWLSLLALLPLLLLVSKAREAKRLRQQQQSLAREHDQLRQLQSRQLLMLEQIATGHSLPQLLEELIAEAAQPHPERSMALLTLDEEAQQLHLQAAHQLPAQLAIQLKQIPLSDIPCWHACLQQGKPAYYDLRRTPPRSQPLQRQLQTLQLDSCWSYPLQARDRTLGVLALLLHSDSGPSIGQHTRLEEWGRLAASAIAMAHRQEQLEEQSDLLQTAFNQLPYPVFARDAQHRFVLCNRATSKLLGIPQALLINQPISSLLSDMACLQQALRDDLKVIETGQAIEHHGARCHLPNGEEHLFHTHCQPLVTRQGIVALGLCVDISDHKQHEVDLLKLASAMEHNSNATLIADRHGCIEYVNAAFTRQTGFTVSEILEKTVDRLLPHTAPVSLPEAIRHTLLERRNWHGTLTLQKKSGDWFRTQVTISPILNHQGHFSHLIATGQAQPMERPDVTQHLSLYDTLTGLENHRLFLEHLKQTLRSIKRHQHPAAVLYIDLDHFKQLNDRIGHEAGDQVLLQTALRLRQNVREEDCVARLECDRFTVLLQELNKAEDVHAVATKLLDTVAHPLSIQGEPVTVTASIGVAIISSRDSDPDTLLRQALHAMSQAKLKGRNCIKMSNGLDTAGKSDTEPHPSQMPSPAATPYMQTPDR